MVRPALCLAILAVLLTVAGSGSADGIDAGESDAGASVPTPEAILYALEHVGSWARVGDATRYTPDNLWEYIDGAAALFQSYGFTEMATAEYRPSIGKAALTVDLYLLPDDLHAFGVYSRERGAEATLERIGAQGYVVPPDCRFYRGRYYAKLSLIRPPDDAERRLRHFALALSRRLSGSTSLPPATRAFPEKGLQQAGLLFVGSDLMGHAFLKDGFLVDYDLGGDVPARLFLHAAADETAARDAFAGLMRFFLQRGEIHGPQVALGDEAFAGEEPFYGLSLVFRRGRAVGGMVRLPTLETGREVVSELLRRLGELEIY